MIEFLVIIFIFGLIAVTILWVIEFIFKFVGSKLPQKEDTAVGNDILDHYPFSKAILPKIENVLWTGCNPTFHRGGEWGIIITSEALYYFSPFWGMLSRWKRYSLNDIESVEFIDSRRFPMLSLLIENKRTKLRTPYDSYEDEMERDRKELREALAVLQGLL